MVEKVLVIFGSCFSLPLHFAVFSQGSLLRKMTPQFELMCTQIQVEPVLSLQAGRVMQCWYFWLGLILVPTACLLKDFAWTA